MTMRSTHVRDQAIFITGMGPVQLQLPRKIKYMSHGHGLRKKYLSHACSCLKKVHVPSEEIEKTSSFIIRISLVFVVFI